MSRTIQPPTMHTKLVAASISDMVQEWYQGKCEVPPMQADTFEQRISRFQPDIAAHVAAEVAKARAEDVVRLQSAADKDAENMAVLVAALRAAKTNARKAFNQTENFYEILSAVDDTVNAALAQIGAKP